MAKIAGTTRGSPSTDAFRMDPIIITAGTIRGIMIIEIVHITARATPPATHSRGFA